MVTSFFALVILAVVAALWIWAVIDILRTKFASPNTTLLMIILVLFFPVAGSIIYFLIRRNFIKEKGPRFNPKFSPRD